MDFSRFPTYSRYRTLHKTDPFQRGYDVWALQVAINNILGVTLTLDGILGNHTQASIEALQREIGISADGLAGGQTQFVSALKIAHELNTGGVPQALIKGQVEHESGGRLGNYSPRRDDGTYDAGVVQRNSAYTDPAIGFHPVKSLGVYLAETRVAFNHFEGVVPERRRWALAAGAWNAPAFACYLAKAEGAIKVKASETLKPTEVQRETFERYMDSVTAYL